MTALLDAGRGNSVTRLSGKVALVTGGGTGIGGGMALGFAGEGASVAVAGRRLEKLREVIGEVQKRGGAGLAMECDVTRARDVERAVKGTVERFGRLNVLVNSAGTLHVSTVEGDRKSTRLNSSHQIISYAVFCLKKKNKKSNNDTTQTQHS